MKSIMHATKISLPEKTRIELVNILNKTLVNVADLYAQLKQAHWNIKGESFMSLHLLFDKIAEEIEEQVDTIAERITSLGGTALGTIQEIAKNTSLPMYPTDIFTAKEHIEHLTHSIATLGELTRINIDIADELDDMVSNDIFVSLTSLLDKNLWFIEAHSQK